MKTVQSYLKFFFLIGSLLVFVTYTGCNNDDEEGGNESLLIGVWTITDANIEADIGGLSIKDYFINVGGFSEVEADAFATLFESMLALNFVGTLQIKDNYTYITNFGGESDDGTWSLNSAGDKITLDAGTVDEMVITIISLTENTLVASTDMTELADIDENPLSPDVEISLTVELTFSK
jgi:hypothetical protein